MSSRNMTNGTRRTHHAHSRITRSDAFDLGTGIRGRMGAKFFLAVRDSSYLVSNNI